MISSVSTNLEVKTSAPTTGSNGGQDLVISGNGFSSTANPVVSVGTGTCKITSITNT